MPPPHPLAASATTSAVASEAATDSEVKTMSLPQLALHRARLVANSRAPLIDPHRLSTHLNCLNGATMAGHRVHPIDEAKSRANR